MSILCLKHLIKQIQPRAIVFAILLSFVLVGCNSGEDTYVEIPGTGPVYKISAEGNNKFWIEGTKSSNLSSLIRLESFGNLRPELVRSRDWDQFGELPDPVPGAGGRLWSWWVEGSTAARQIVGRVDSEYGKPYYLLRLKLYTRTPLDFVQPEVRRRLVQLEQFDAGFSSISFYSGGGGEASLRREEDGAYIYWHEADNESGQ